MIKKIIISLISLGLLGQQLPVSAAIEELVGSVKEQQERAVAHNIVNIPDSKLKEKLNKVLNQTTGSEITEGQLAGIVELNISGSRITDLTGLEYATRLNILYAQNNQITDVSPLANLTNLEGLHIYDNQISDITPLENLTNLRTLYIHNNPISDITAIAKMKNLAALYIYNNPISDISVLTELKSLRVLYSYNNQISDITPLKNLTNLRTLYLNNNQISDITPLSNLMNLTTLYLENNQIDEIKALENLQKLKTLQLQNNNISDGEVLENLTNLEILYIQNNQMSDIGFLSNLTNLKDLNMSNQVVWMNEKATSPGNVFTVENPIKGIELDEKEEQFLLTARNGISGMKYMEQLDFSKEINLNNIQSLYNATIFLPVILDYLPEIHGATDLTIKVGDLFDAMQGITVTDKEDDATATLVKLEVTGDVDTSKAGKYVVTYTATD
ncbi:MAG: leucine-rich repeat domain-containing protein, partial [Culicoidibacterales bacterium]